MTDYIALLHKDKVSDYGVSFPDFPGCVTAGRTLEEARRMAAEALTFHIEGMIEDGETIPDPSPLDAIMQERENLAAAAFIVAVPTATERAMRVNVTLPESLVKRIDEVTDNRSKFLAQAASRALQPPARARARAHGARKAASSRARKRMA
jgi:predicted RNase H-like HicB family nuclease